MSLYRRSGTANYWCRFTVGGREIRQSTGTPHREEAEEYETKLRSRYWRETRLGESFHTFGQAGERWLAETDKKSKDKDEQRIRWFNSFLSDVPLREINRDVLDAARRRLVREGLSKTTVNHYMGVVRQLLRQANEWGWLDVLPKVPMFRVSLPEPRWLRRDQFDRLLLALPEHTKQMALFAVATGLRKSNITGLTWDRVDLEAGFAYVPSNQAKAGRGIPIPLNQTAKRVLREQRGKHERWVFVWKGKRIEQVSTKAWRRACKAAGLEGLRFHDLRHTWASWQIQAETPLSVVQALGGWQSPQMVQRYAHLSPGHLKAYAERTEVGTGPPTRKRKSLKSGG